jgi:hypothetical protein
MSHQKAPAGSGHPVGGPSRSERPVDVPGGFTEDESILEDEGSVFLQAVSGGLPITQAELA